MRLFFGLSAVESMLVTFAGPTNAFQVYAGVIGIAVDSSHGRIFGMMTTMSMLYYDFNLVEISLLVE